MGQDNSCHPYITSNNCDADSAYGSTAGSNCCDGDIALYHLTTSDDSDADDSYDADDEIDGKPNECPDESSLCTYRKRPDITRTRPDAEYPRTRPDSGLFFCLSKSDRSGSQYSYLMNIIKERAKLSEKIYKVEDEGKRRLFSVEYDVIGTEDDDSGHEGRNEEAVIKPIITFRHHEVSDEGLVEIIASYKRRRLCKVKSLPDMRIPLRKKSTRCKPSMYSGSIDRYKGKNTNTLTSPSNTSSNFSFKLCPLNYRAPIDSDHYYSTKPRCSSLLGEEVIKTTSYHVMERKTLPTSKCVELKKVSDRRLGNFQICHMIETLEK